MPYSFVSNKKLVLKKNRDITLPSTVSLFNINKILIVLLNIFNLINYGID